MMRPYPKIDTLFERAENHKIDPLNLKLRRPVMADISRWVVTEKIDGTNIRVGLTNGSQQIDIGGRTDNAQLPADLMKSLYEIFTVAKMESLFLPDTAIGTGITLFGEGYGTGIQKGGDYRADKGFTLFDALIECDEHAYWQDDATVTDFAHRLEIPRVPMLGHWDLGRIVQEVRDGIPSKAAWVRPRRAEGIVARPIEPLFDRRGQRLILKLKTGG